MLDDHDEFLPSERHAALQNIANDFGITVVEFTEIILETRGRMAPFLRAHAERLTEDAAYRLVREFDVIMLERGLKRRSNVS